MATRRQRRMHNKMIASIAAQFQDLEWLNENMLNHNMILMPCQTLAEALDILSHYFFCIYHFAKGNFKPFENAGKLRAYIMNAQRNNGFNPLKFPLKVAKDNGFGCLLLNID